MTAPPGHAVQVSRAQSAVWRAMASNDHVDCGVPDSTGPVTQSFVSLSKSPQDPFESSCRIVRAYTIAVRGGWCGAQ